MSNNDIGSNSNYSINNSRGIRIRIAPGLVEGVIEDAPTRKYTAKWIVPQFTAQDQERFIESLSADAFLTGRWLSGAMTEQDRKAAGASEDDWQASCMCGRTQPCRHAVSVMFRLREQAKVNPWIWLDVRGLFRDETLKAVHERRRKRVHALIKGELPLSIEPQKAESSPIVPHAEDPPFWNRDVSFADWLDNIYTNSRKGESTS